ncbi:AlpA family phage regulatory protein [Paracoccus saliphilus]|uniref:AlpA family phage regulatory protein n=1 Tax=Paracoccus saliphilus TaxID=405559 RepID=A0ABY7SEC4_9RHOB|nr:AlpA family phage regulatory protein [Paracoccus saliphilus]
MTVEQVAERYNVSTDSIWRWKRQGNFPRPVRVGGNCTRWRLDDLIEHESTLPACFIGRLDYMSAA